MARSPVDHWNRTEYRANRGPRYNRAEYTVVRRPDSEQAQCIGCGRRIADDELLIVPTMRLPDIPARRTGPTAPATFALSKAGESHPT